MKKLIFIVWLTLILQAFLPTAYAQDNGTVYDSLHIPAEELENATRITEDDVIIKLYHVHLFSYICQDSATPVNERLQNDPTISHHLTFGNPDDLEKDEWTQYTQRDHPLLQVILYPERVFEAANLSEDLEIYETYACTTDYEGWCVYYVTNKGNYVCYAPYYAKEGQEVLYLLTEALIRELYPKHLEHIRAYHANENGTPTLDQSFDLSDYRVRGYPVTTVCRHDPSELKNEDEIPHRTEPFFPTAAVIAAAVSLAVLGGVTLAAWLYRKKTHR